MRTSSEYLYDGKTLISHGFKWGESISSYVTCYTLHVTHYTLHYGFHYIDYTMSVYLSEGIVKDVLNDLDKDELSILIDKIRESMTTDGLDAYYNAYHEWMEQIPQLTQKYLKGKGTFKVSCRLTECGSEASMCS